jgi:hypothetical protein
LKEKYWWTKTDILKMPKSDNWFFGIVKESATKLCVAEIYPRFGYAEIFELDFGKEYGPGGRYPYDGHKELFQFCKDLYYFKPINRKGK